METLIHSRITAKEVQRVAQQAYAAHRAKSKANEIRNLEELLRLVFMLCHACESTHSEDLLEAAKEQFDVAFQLYDLNPQNMSYVNGGAGLIYIGIKLFEITKNENYLNRALKIIQEHSLYYLESDQVSENLFTGRSGMLLSTLYLYDQTKNSELLKIIDQLSRKILSKVVNLEGALAWYVPFELSKHPLCSFGHGTAGVGYVFQQLGDYFDYPFFKKIAALCFSYVNGVGFDEEHNLWEDFRRNIESASDLEKHVRYFENKDCSFFETPSFEYDIEHGAAGILFALSHSDELSAIWDLSQSSKAQTSKDILDLIQVHVANFQSSGDREELRQAHTLSKHSLLNKNEIDEIEVANLSCTLLSEKACTFYLPQAQFDRGSNARISLPFLTDELFLNNLAKQYYGYTIQLLISRNIKVVLNQLTSPVFHLDRCINAILNRVKTKNSDVDAILQTFEYERLLNRFKLKIKHNPIWHVHEFLSFKTRIAQLQIKNKELGDKQLVLSKQATIKTHYVVNDHLGKKLETPRAVSKLWKRDTDKGIVEIDIEPIRFILDSYKVPNSVKTGLTETMSFCKALNDVQLRPLLSYSDSRDKKHLLQRLPFIYLYQIKILISEGVLEFSE
ncbi:MAG: lanthionine synthetase LanC family protein [Bacteroidota bacterium]